MPLTPDGAWDPTTFAELRPSVVALWQQAYGDNAPTDPQTPDGLAITAITLTAALAFDANTGLWANSFFRSAIRVSLDRILDLFAKLREPAKASTAEVVFYGTPLTAIPAATVVITADASENRFATDEADAIGAAGNSDTWVARILDAQDGVEYIASIDANPPSSYVAGPTDTVEDIAVRLAADITLDGFGTSVAAGVDASGNGLLVVDIVGGPGDLVVGDLGGSGTVIDATEAVRTPVTATTTGPLAAVAGTLRNLANPIAGVAGQINDADAVIGVNEESDDAFRARHLQTLFANSARTDGGMKDAVAQLDGVEANLVRSNRTVDPEDAEGRPIGSVENIVLKTQTNPATDQEIANAIARHIPAGVEPYGLRSFGLGTTIDGEVVEIFATDVEERYLHLDVSIIAGEGFPTGDIATAVATAISTYFDAGLVTTSTGTFSEPGARLVIGRDWLETATHTPINLATNSSSASISIDSDLTANPGDLPSFSTVPTQPADDRQIIRVDASRIAVNIIFV